MQEKLYNLLMNDDEITWQSIIYDLIRTDQMNPWDIDITKLAKRYIETVNKLQEMNFFLSGKVLLASAILLKIKSNKLIYEDLAEFDALLYPPDDVDLTEDFNAYNFSRENIDIPRLAIKTPQARRRKVTINDLLGALHKALGVNQRKVLRKIRERSYRAVEIPEKKMDISMLIAEIYNKIKLLFKKQEKITFTQLVPSDKRDDKIRTFIPLLHLDHKEKIFLHQQEHLGEISILKISS